MPEGITSEALLDNIMDTVSDAVMKQKAVSFSDDKSDSISSQLNKLFGRKKPVHHLLGGGKSADLLLWRNKKISAGVLTGATVVWILFEWLEYNILPLMCFGLVIGMIGLFIWSNLLSRPASRIALPEQVFVNIATSAGAEVNRALGFLQDVACRGNIKQLLSIVGCLLFAAILGSWCNFLTVLYIGFLAAHTLPVVYEKYDDQIDAFVNNLLGQLQRHYSKLDDRVLSRIPKGNVRGKKVE